jgi:uncharacterized protein (TIGR02246 family)
MRWPRIFLLIPCCLFAAPPADEIRALMAAKQDAWNRGDIEAFMSAYERSPETTFLGSGGITRGYDAVLERYRRNYASRERMGQLAFTVDEVRMAGEDTAILLGRFSLARSEAAGGPSSGRFTLVWKRTAAGWRIIHDHTSP